MAGTIVTDRIESDASYASSITVASPMVIANTISMAGGSFSSNVNFSSNTLFINSTGLGRVGIGIVPSNTKFEITSNSTQMDLMQFNDTSTSAGPRSWRIGPGTGLASRFVIRDVTGSTNPFSIDTLGNVYQPLQTSFQAFKSGGNQEIRVSGETQITYETANWNIGNGYNTVTSRFTAPTSGKYLFIVNFNPYSIDVGGSYTRAMIKKNGSLILVGAMNYPDNSGDQSYSVSLIEDVLSSDYFEVFIQTNTDASFGLSEGRIWNTFNGYLLG